MSEVSGVSTAVDAAGLTAPGLTQRKPTSTNTTNAAATTNTAPQTDTSPAQPPQSKKSDFGTRTLYSLILMALFVLVIYCGHICVCVFIVLCEVLIFREILALGFEASKHQPGKIPHFRTVNWGFFISAIYFVYGKSVLAHFEDQGKHFMQLQLLQFLSRHHSFLAMTMYVSCFLAFVMTLSQGNYMFQFGAFARTHIAIILVVVQGNFMILNVKSGMIWFIMPAMLVIFNDSFAYLVGRSIGRTPLMAISPKKTVEGYVGGAIFTVLGAIIMAWGLSKFEFMYCPLPEFTNCGFVCRVTCDKPSLFVTREIAFPPNLLRIMNDVFGNAFSIRVAPIQLHALALALFASIVAPFGGLFASGIKRAFGIKDFASWIPGHGGVTDRFDCQFIMAMLTYVYTINFVGDLAPDVQKILALVSDLSLVEKIQLAEALAKLLENAKQN